MKTALFARCSTNDRKQDTENQVKQMREWCQSNGHEIVELYEEYVSGSGLKKRPVFDRMMADAKEHRFEQLIFWSLDRFSRAGVLATLTKLQELDDAKVCWKSFTEAYLDSCGLFRDAVLAILAAVAKQERVRISERVRAGLDVARAKGRRGGRPKIERNAALVSMIGALRGEGKSLTEVSDALKARGYRISRSWIQRAEQGGLSG